MLHTRLPYGDGRHVPEKLSHVRFSVQPLSPHHPPSFVLCSATWQRWHERMSTSPYPLAVDGPPTLTEVHYPPLNWLLWGYVPVLEASADQHAFRIAAECL